MSVLHGSGVSVQFGMVCLCWVLLFLSGCGGGGYHHQPDAFEENKRREERAAWDRRVQAQNREMDRQVRTIKANHRQQVESWNRIRHR